MLEEEGNEGLGKDLEKKVRKIIKGLILGIIKMAFFPKLF